MTEEEKILLDIALPKIPRGKPFRIQGALHNALVGLADKYPQAQFQRLADIVTFSPDSIRDILLAEGYTKVIENSTHLDQLTEKGEQAQNCGGHEQYKEWERHQQVKQNIEDFPKKNWFIYEPLKYLLPLIGGWLIGHYTCNSPKNNEKANNQQIDTIRQTIPSPSSPKISSKKDSS
jgi:hypothetical protein